MAIRAMIAEDHPVVRRGLTGLLNKQPDLDVIGVAECGDDVLNLTDPDELLGAIRAVFGGADY
jgi:DNA-binding NarL/FixJ family response regulator